MVVDLDRAGGAEVQGLDNTGSWGPGLAARHLVAELVLGSGSGQVEDETQGRPDLD